MLRAAARAGGGAAPETSPGSACAAACAALRTRFAAGLVSATALMVAATSMSPLAVRISDLWLGPEMEGQQQE